MGLLAVEHVHGVLNYQFLSLATLHMNSQLVPDLSHTCLKTFLSDFIRDTFQRRIENIICNLTFDLKVLTDQYKYVESTIVSIEIDKEIAT